MRIAPCWHFGQRRLSRIGSVAYHAGPFDDQRRAAVDCATVRGPRRVLPALFMQIVDVSIVNVAIPSIQRRLGASCAEVQLVLACHQLAYACVLITAARWT